MPKEEKALPLMQQQRYKAFRQLLGQVNQAIVLQNASRVALQSRVTELQQFFRDQLLSLPMDELTSETQHWVQSYQVEIDKQLRLLGMDMLFLQAAKQTDTASQRQQQVGDRLELLRRYCEALMGEE